MKKDLMLIDDLLDLTDFLEEEYSFRGNEAYPHLLGGIAKKSYYYLYSFKQLANDKKNGDVVIDLSRSLLESMIVLMFVQEFGKESKAKKILMYAPVETMGDGQYAIDANINLPIYVLEQRRKEYDEAKVDYLRPTKKEIGRKEAVRSLTVLEKMNITLTGKQKKEFVKNMIAGKNDEENINKSPLGVDLETMIVELNKKGKFPGNLKQSLERVYVYGNRKNHLSSNDINMMLDNNERIKKNQGYHMSIGLYIGLLSYIMIMIELADLRKDVKLEEKLEVAKEKLLSEREDESQGIE